MFSFFNSFKGNKLLFKCIPNLITFFRILITIKMIIDFINGYDHIGKFIFMSILVFISDIGDGKIARKFNLESGMGELLDIAADIFYVLSMSIIMALKGITPSYYVFAVVLEFSVFIVTSRHLKENKRYVAFDVLGMILAVVYYVYPLIIFIIFKELEFLYNLINTNIIITLIIMTFITILYRLSLCFKKININMKI